MEISCKSKQKKIILFPSQNKKFESCTERKTELDKELRKIITTDLSQYHTEKCFIEFVKKLDLRYSLPNTDSISNTMLLGLLSHQINRIF